MNKKLQIIYIPGIGDDTSSLQNRAVMYWRRWNVEPYLFRVGWDDSEPWDEKSKRLLAFIDKLSADGNKVALVGVSAGASAAIGAYAERLSKIVGCVLIAGKVNRVESIGPYYRKNFPPLIEAVRVCEKSLVGLGKEARVRIMSIYALADQTVYKPDSKIPGAINRMVPTPGHITTIATQITLGAPFFLRFLKRLAR